MWSVIASKKYSELNDKVISLNELKNYPLIFQAKGSNTRNFLDNFLKEKNITLKPNIELASYSLVTEFCKAGSGIGYAVKEFVQKENRFVSDSRPRRISWRQPDYKN